MIINQETSRLLDTPVLAVDLDRLEKNIRVMAEFARRLGVRLRPHVKAHKTPQIALRQLDAGAAGITAAKIGEAEAMAGAGIQDILVAYPLVGVEKVRRFIMLARRIRVQTLVDSMEGACRLAEAAGAWNMNIEILIKVNTGLDRCGVNPGQAAVDLARQVKSLRGILLKGILTHAGHAYSAGSPEEIAEIGRREGSDMVNTARLLRKAGLPAEIISVGSTPTARHAGLVDGVTEIRPGNYVFNDCTQVSLGVACWEDCALAVMARVVSKPSPQRAVIDAGSKTLGLDRGAHGSGLLPGFGRISGKEDILIERLSEEHGILKLTPGGSQVEIGDALEIIPNHACTVVNNFEKIWAVRKGRLEDVWTIAARGKIT